jgi:hypothetical protein
MCYKQPEAGGPGTAVCIRVTECGLSQGGARRRLGGPGRSDDRP